MVDANVKFVVRVSLSRNIHIVGGQQSGNIGKRKITQHLYCNRVQSVGRDYISRELGTSLKTCGWICLSRGGIIDRHFGRSGKRFSEISSAFERRWNLGQ